MLLVILGAGASFDSSPTIPPPPGPTPPEWEQARPPLTYDLFNDRRHQYHFLARYPAASGIVRRIQRRIEADENLERILWELQTEANSYPQRLLQLLAIRFYLRDYLADCSGRWYQQHDTVTTYAEFVDQINRHSTLTGEEVTYVTFNYDTLLDKTLEAHCLRNLRTIDGYLAPGGPAYIKVHGSVNWRRQTGVRGSESMGTGPTEVIAQAIEIDQTNNEDGYLVLESESNWTSKIGGGQGPAYVDVPAIAIPVERKTERNFEMPTSHRQALQSALKRASRILVIGWRGSEEHFNELLKAHNRGLAVPITVVCGTGGAGPTVENLKSLGFEKITDASCGFTDFVERGLLHGFLVGVP